MRLKRMWNGYPSISEIDRKRFEKEITLPPASIQYVMYFTPRSGSSWLTDIATQSKHLSTPGECFNPNFMPNMTRAMNATNMDEYCDILVRRRNTNGVFGAQITYHQLNAVFKNRDDFLARFPSKKCFWLIREDILLQAISLYKMQQTQIGHSDRSSAEERQSKEQDFVYDAAEIKRWVDHIRSAEISTEALFEHAGLTPYRMSYEQNTRLRPARVINAMGHYLGLSHIKGLKLETAHKKIGTSINDEFAERFRSEQPELMENLSAERATMLESIKRIHQRDTA